jgi:protein arginine kinase
MLKWYEEKGDNSDVVISSRVRLARNLEKYSFSMKLSDEDAGKLVAEVNLAMKDYQNEDGNFSSCILSEIDEIAKNAMVERHILSPLMAQKKQETGLLLSKNESVSIMINEEDHIRIQTLAGGMNLKKPFEEANAIDDAVNQIMKFAFDKKFGYLTTCPTNVGTGMRASYMVFLPALGAMGKINRLANEVSKYGVALRGMYGEGSQGSADIYQISNQKTLGNTEQDIIGNLNNIVAQVIKQERKRREYVFQNNYDMIEDQIYRAYGILKYTKQMTTKDAMTLLSQIKLGVDIGVIKFRQGKNIYKLMMDIQPANLQMRSGKNIGSGQRDKIRAEYLNAHLPEMLK